MNTPTIIRAPHTIDRRYVSIARSSAQDKSLSWEAHGILDYLLSKPDDWIVRPKELERPGCKRDKVHRILKELSEHGYLTRERRYDNKHRITGMYYQVHETPQAPETEKQATEIPTTENPPLTDNRGETENRGIQETENTYATPTASPVGIDPEKPIPTPSQIVAPTPRQPSQKLPPVASAYTSKPTIDTKPLITAATKALVPSKSGNGTAQLTSAAVPEQEPKRDLIFEWVCSSVLRVSLDDVKANKSLRGRVNVLTSMIVNSAQIRSKTGEKLTLAEKNELAAKLPKMIPFFQKLKPGCEFPTGNGTFGALVSQWFEAGCKGGIEPPSVKTFVEKDFDPDCPLGCKEGTLYFTDEKGNRSSDYCPCMRRLYKEHHGVDLKG